MNHHWDQFSHFSIMVLGKTLIHMILHICCLIQPALQPDLSLKTQHLDCLRHKQPFEPVIDQCHIRWSIRLYWPLSGLVRTNT